MSLSKNKENFLGVAAIYNGLNSKGFTEAALKTGALTVGAMALQAHEDQTEQANREELVSRALNHAMSMLVIGCFAGNQVNDNSLQQIHFAYLEFIKALQISSPPELEDIVGLCDQAISNEEDLIDEYYNHAVNLKLIQGKEQVNNIRDLIESITLSENEELNELQTRLLEISYFVSPRSKATNIALAVFVSPFFQLNRLYTGTWKPLHGLLFGITYGYFGIGYLYEIFLAATGTHVDDNFGDIDLTYGKHENFQSWFKASLGYFFLYGILPSASLALILTYGV
jgi:hypothetical protein